MRTRISTQAGPHCGHDNGYCCGSIVIGEGRCCAQCTTGSHAERTLTTSDRPDRDDVTPNLIERGEPLQADEEDRLVAGLLDRAQQDDDGVELADAPASIAAYKSLAAARDVPLETVLRAAVRHELATVVSPPGSP